MLAPFFIAKNIAKAAPPLGTLFAWQKHDDNCIEHFLSKELNCMRASLRGKEELAARVQQTLAPPTKKEAEMIVNAVVAALEATLLNNLGTDGFTLKLGSFGKFSVRHTPGHQRRIPFTGETILTKNI